MVDIIYGKEKMVKIINAKAMNDYKLLLDFSDGERKIFDVKPLLTVGIFTNLKDENVFRNFILDYETVTWCDGEIDIAPETMYLQGKSVL